MSETRFVTRHGYKILADRVRRLEEKLRTLQSEVGEQADTGGNQWHDNAGYEQLVIDIRGVDRQLRDAYNDLRGVEVIDYPESPDSVCIGCRIEIELNGQSETWEIVGFGETDADNNRIAYNTPLAQAVLNLKVGDSTQAQIGRRMATIQVLAINPIKEKLR